ncbi:MAG: hypothetical protein MRERC_2c104 [Mycoplasmataceae bacterium RC_NB112A]|nr:MAG: hypothetical protein MRERC_2c104 [Mycoplasmataceae bacterium RC_NB112A]
MVSKNDGQSLGKIDNQNDLNLINLKIVLPKLISKWRSDRQKWLTWINQTEKV